jgi:DNA-binding phage protein
MWTISREQMRLSSRERRSGEVWDVIVNVPKPRITRCGARGAACAAFIGAVAYMLREEARVAGSSTGFDRFLSQKLRDPAFRVDYEKARAEITATDAVIRALEDARARSGLSKAELARRVEVKPEIIRRLLTDEGGNPTIATVLKVATTLGYHLELVPNDRRRAPPAREAAHRVARPTGARSGGHATGTPRRAAARARSRAR